MLKEPRLEMYVVPGERYRVVPKERFSWKWNYCRIARTVRAQEGVSTVDLRTLIKETIADRRWVFSYEEL